MQLFPLHPQQIKTVGFDSWTEIFTVFPDLTNRDIIVNNILTAYADIIQECKAQPSLQYFFLAHVKTVLLFIQVILRHQNLEWARINNYTHVGMAQNKFPLNDAFDLFCEILPDPQSIISPASSIQSTHIAHIKSWLKYKIHYPRLVMSGSPHILFLEKVDSIGASFCQQERKKTGFIFLHEYLASFAFAKSHPELKRVEELINLFYEKLSCIKNLECLINISNLAKERFQQMLISSFPLFHHFKSCFRKRNEDVIAVSAGGIISRLFLSAVRATQHKVYGCTHGHLISGAGQQQTVIDGTIFDEYLFFSKAMVETFKNAAKESIFSFVQPYARYVSDSNYNRISKSKIRKRAKTNKYIMIMGGPIRACFYFWNPVVDRFNYLFLEYNLIVGLKNRGFSVCYKGHPDRKAEMKGIFSNYVDCEIFEPFENILDKADCLIFRTTETTTFGYAAMFTNIPMVLIETTKDKRDSKIRNFLEKRCAIVPANFDEKGRVITDIEAICAAISYARECAFPLKINGTD
ncbi:hypothetical protein ACFL3D_02070 [Candidatus Omnitrophota bacterium]